jgi:hypothetical protein
VTRTDGTDGAARCSDTGGGDEGGRLPRTGSAAALSESESAPVQDAMLWPGAVGARGAARARRVGVRARENGSPPHTPRLAARSSPTRSGLEIRTRDLKRWMDSWSATAFSSWQARSFSSFRQRQLYGITGLGLTLIILNYNYILGRCGAVTSTVPPRPPPPTPIPDPSSLTSRAPPLLRSASAASSSPAREREGVWGRGRGMGRGW